MHKMLFEVFKRWTEGPLATYRFADTEVYASVDRDNLYQASLNAYIKTEADIKVKFGGFLEAELLRQAAGFSVHAELNVYQSKPTWWADLSVHDVSTGALWTTETPNPITETLKAVMEIKYANYRDPNWVFEKGHVKYDMEKLLCLEKDVSGILILLDEGGGIDEPRIRDTLSSAMNSGVSVFSNNEALVYVAP